MHSFKLNNTTTASFIASSPYKLIPQTEDYKLYLQNSVTIFILMWVCLPLYAICCLAQSVFSLALVCIYNVVICLVHLVTHMGCFVHQILLRGSVNTLFDPLDLYFTPQYKYNIFVLFTVEQIYWYVLILWRFHRSFSFSKGKLHHVSP